MSGGLVQDEDAISRQAFITSTNEPLKGEETSHSCSNPLCLLSSEISVGLGWEYLLVNFTFITGMRWVVLIQIAICPVEPPHCTTWQLLLQVAVSSSTYTPKSKKTTINSWLVGTLVQGLTNKARAVSLRLV